MNEIKCKICGSSSVSCIFKGKIRVGKFNELSPSEEIVNRCNECQAAFLLTNNFEYESEEYRIAVDGQASPSSYYKIHDSEQAEKIAILGTGELRGKIIADIGCGAGAFLDFFSLLTMQTIAIEPCRFFHSELERKGHKIFSYVSDAVPSLKGKVDIATCFAVIEHLPDPLGFLYEIRELLKPNGRILISTPNSNDWLLQLVPEYKSFFFRKAHSFYFNDISLKYILEKASFTNIKFIFKQQYDISNAITWIRDRVPKGDRRWSFLNAFDSQYRSYIEQIGMSNFIYAIAERAE